VILKDVVVLTKTGTTIKGAVRLKLSPLLSVPLIKPVPVTEIFRLTNPLSHNDVCEVIVSCGP